MRLMSITDRHAHNITLQYHEQYVDRITKFSENINMILRVTDQSDVSRNFDIFTLLHENVQQSVHFDVMTLILLSDH